MHHLDLLTKAAARTASPSPRSGSTPPSESPQSALPGSADSAVSCPSSRCARACNAASRISASCKIKNGTSNRRNPRPGDVNFVTSTTSSRDARRHGAHRRSRTYATSAQCPYGPSSVSWQPVHHHAGLRERKRQKRANRIQRNQPVCHALEQDQDQRRKARQRIDAMREQQPPPAQHKHMRQVVPHRNRPRQPRKTRERRIRAQRKAPDQHAAHRRDVIKPCPAKHRRHQQISAGSGSPAASGTIAVTP